MYVYGSSGWQSAGSSVNGTSDRQTYTATSGQTVFAATYDTGYVDVYLNGVKLLAGTDFTATNGTSITLASGAAVNDIVDIVAYGTFALADHYSKSQSDARYVEVAGDTMTGDLDITGTLTSDGLTVDGNVGFGTSSPSQSWTGGTARTFQVQGPSSTITVLRVNEASDTYGDLQLVSGASNEVALYNFNNGAMRFGTNGTERMRIDSSGNVGIGTTSPGADLDIERTAGDSNDILRLGSTDNYYFGFARSNTTGALSIQGNQTNFNNILLAPTSGNVGIGTSSPSSTFRTSIYGDGSSIIGGVEFRNAAAGGSTFTIGHSSATSPSATLNVTDAANLIFQTSNTEAMRIDSSGNFLVGKTASSLANDGFQVHNTGYIGSTNSGAATAYFNRKTNDGDIVNFQKDGTTVGSIQSRSGLGLILNSANSYDLGLALNGTVAFYLSTTRFYPNSDNFADLGTPSLRFDDIYATNGTIQTSDQNEKQQIASLTDAEMTAAKAISKLFKTFKWNDSVAEKGDAARTHTGVIAQEVEQAMTDAGLNAGDYAFFISTTWWETQTEVPAVEADEENGVEAQEAYTRTDTYDTAEEAPEGATERNRKGIRYPQLLSFIGAATEQRLASIETRLDALEAN
jgi:hypothetical protein